MFDRYNIITERDVAQAAAQRARSIGSHASDTDPTRTAQPVAHDGPLAHQAAHLPFKPPPKIRPLGQPAIYQEVFPFLLGWRRVVLGQL